MKSRLLESLGTRVSDVSYRRYNLSEIISESYSTLYNCEKNSNLRNLVEAHIADVKDNPTDIERLSHQLCDIKQVSRLIESNKMKDEDLVDKKYFDKVEPQKERMLQKKSIDESSKTGALGAKVGDIIIDTKTGKEGKVEKVGQSGNDDLLYVNFGRGLRKINAIDDAQRFGRYELKKSIDESSNAEKDYMRDWAEMDYESGHPIEDYHEWAKLCADEGIEPTEELFNIYMDYYNSIGDDIDEACEDRIDDSDLTEEEVEELAKHLEEIRKNKKPVTEANSKEHRFKRRVTESTAKGRKLKRRVTESKSEGRNLKKRVSESKSYKDLDLSEFSKKSSSKAFIKTFKKLSKKLHEGTALTRRESIALYKAANSAMTQLSVELEHNPEFLDTFRESVSLLSVDVDRVLSSLKEGKAPSKATMKSLARFSEALFCEDEDSEEEMIDDTEDINDELPDEEEIPEETEEESEEFDQEYADARVELHKELADKHADTENPEIAEKIVQDAEEVVNLPGITDEQVAEITGEEVAPEDGESEEEASEEETDLDLGDTNEDITDDELAELKKHLTEMRKARRSR